MFNIEPTELLVLGTVALLVIPPKDLPKAMRVAGYWVGRARGVARQFRSGFDSMVREAELTELQKQWAEENARIMAEHPMPAIAQLEPEPLLPAPVPATPSENDAPVMVEQPAIRPEIRPEIRDETLDVSADATPEPKPKPKRKPRTKAAPAE
jgi:sec-independent protein translocase protein TatB